MDYREASFGAVDTSTAHPARRYNYLLGGEDNFQADRESGDELARLNPAVKIAAVENRAFLQRAVGFITRQGIRTEYFEADLREPEKILSHPALRETLDLTQPVGLVLVSVLPFVAGDGVAGPIVRTLLDAVPPGSYLVLSHATFDTLDPELAAKYWQMFHAGRSDIWPRSEAEFRDLFAGLELVEPGIVQVHEWRPTPDATPRTAKEINNWGAVARKP